MVEIFDKAVEDAVTLFILNDAVAGQIARLNGVLQASLEGRDYPPAVQQVIAEAALLSSLVAVSFPPDHRFMYKVKSEGPIRLVQVDWVFPKDPDKPPRMRCAAAYEPMKVGYEVPNWNDYPGEITHELTTPQGPGGADIEITRPTLTENFQEYYRRIEQTVARIKLSIGQPIESGPRCWRGSAMMAHFRDIEHDEFKGRRMMENAAASADWRRTLALLSTAESDELSGPGYSVDEAVQRIFYGFKPRIAQVFPVSYGCDCTAEMLKANLLEKTLRDISVLPNINGYFSAQCGFCNKSYDINVAELIAEKRRRIGRRAD